MAVRVLGEPLGGAGSSGVGCFLGSFLSDLFSRIVVCLSIPLYQFSGTIFDICEGDFKPFSAAYSVVLLMFVLVSSRAFSFALVRSLPVLVRSLSFLKRRVG